ncbi:MAG: hypothetical protein DRH90_23500, partial [Deltaproteobacteria bacterium]
MTANQTAPLESRKDFKKTPKGQYEYWETELKAAQKTLKPWQKQGDKIVQRYVDQRDGANSAHSTNDYSKVFRLNMFNSNVTTMQSMLYGRLPKVDVSRKNAIADDDPARVAAEAMERMLNLDIEDNGEEYDAMLRATLQDRLLSGLGCARVRYEVETEQVATLASSDGELVSKDASEQRVTHEAAPIDYYYWGDVLWGWARTFSKVPWIGFRSYLDKDEMQKRFGKDAAEGVQYKKQKITSNEESTEDPDKDSAWMKAEIWEIWDKNTKKVTWFSFGYDKTIETKPDPLQLSGFYPCPPFFMANQTTTLYKPTPDYHLAQDLYNEIDILQTRISILTEAVKVIGVYDAEADGIKRMFKEGVENDLIPVDNWALFAEKGGIQGQIDWVPIEAITNALDRLRSLRDEDIGLLQQITGMADVMRGSLDNQYEGVGQSEIKAKFGSIRIQSLQDEFAVFVGNLMQIKAEIIARHFSPETIAKQSAMQFTPDRELLPQAIQLIKNPDEAKLRISIKAESLAMLDYAQLKEERVQYLNGLSTFLQAAAPLIQQDPRALPFLLEMLKWAMAGFKGSSEIEGVLDKAIEAMRQAPPKDDKPSPEQERGQVQIQLEKMRAEAKQQEMQFKAQSDQQLRQQDMQADIATRNAEMQFDMQKEEHKGNVEMQIMAAKLQSDVQTELLTSQINAEQNDRAVQGEIEKEVIKQRGEIEKLKITKMADAGIKIMEKEADMTMKGAE